jgi:O-antigen/teichoic acid export membrane protein
MNTMQTGHSDISRKLFGHIGLNFIGQGFLVLLNIVAMPYIVHHLGAELYAVVALVQTVAGFAGVLNIGIGRALTKFVSELYWKREFARINEYFQTAWTFCVCSGLLAVLLLLGARDAMARLLFGSAPAVGGDLAHYAIFIAAFGLLTSILLEAISAIPTAAQKFGIRNVIQILVGLVWSLGSVALLAAGYSIRAVLLVNLLSNLVGVTCFAVASRMLIGTLKFYPRFYLGALRKLLTFSLPLMISAITALISLRLDRFIIAYYLPLTAITFYTLPYSLSEKVSLAVSNVISVVYPLTSEMHARQDHDRLQELYLHSTKTLFLVTLPITMVLVTIPGPVLRYWLGADYAQQGATCLAILGWAAFMNSMSAVATVTSLGVGRAWMPSVFSFVTSMLGLVLNLLLVPKYGINGAAWAFLISNAAVVPLFVIMVNRAVGVPFRRYAIDALVRPFIVASVQFAFLFESRASITSLVALLAVCAISLGVFGVTALFVVVRRDERVALVRRVLRLVAVAAPGE